MIDFNAYFENLTPELFDDQFDELFCRLVRQEPQLAASFFLCANLDSIVYFVPKSYFYKHKRALTLPILALDYIFLQHASHLDALTYQFDPTIAPEKLMAFLTHFGFDTNPQWQQYCNTHYLHH